jgi:heptosyltransferase-1
MPYNSRWATILTKPVTTALSMPNILLIKTSSLGDVVHNLPVVSDIRARFPDANVDWVVEDAYGDIVGMHPGVRRVIPVALRRWRANVLSPSNWRDFWQFRRILSAMCYDCVIDTQGLVKSGVLSRMANGIRHGYAASSAREPFATRFYDVHHTVPRDLHAVVRNRRLAAMSLGYDVPTVLDYGIRVPKGEPQAVTAPYCVLLHSTSRADKLWPEASWHQLCNELMRCGFASILPWGGEAENRRSARIAKNCATATVPPALSIPQMARLLVGAKAVIGVDTGLTHLATALDRPVVAMYCNTQPGLTGVLQGKSARARNLGGPGEIPGVDEVLLALNEVAGGGFA